MCCWIPFTVAAECSTVLCLSRGHYRGWYRGQHSGEQLFDPRTRLRGAPAGEVPPAAAQQPEPAPAVPPHNIDALINESMSLAFAKKEKAPHHCILEGSSSLHFRRLIITASEKAPHHCISCCASSGTVKLWHLRPFCITPCISSVQ